MKFYLLNQTVAGRGADPASAGTKGATFRGVLKQKLLNTISISVFLLFCVSSFATEEKVPAEPAGSEATYCVFCAYKDAIEQGVDDSDLCRDFPVIHYEETGACEQEVEDLSNREVPNSEPIPVLYKHAIEQLAGDSDLIYCVFCAYKDAIEQGADDSDLCQDFPLIHHEKTGACEQEIKDLSNREQSSLDPEALIVALARSQVMGRAIEADPDSDFAREAIRHLHLHPSLMMLPLIMPGPSSSALSMPPIMPAHPLSSIR